MKTEDEIRAELRVEIEAEIRVVLDAVYNEKLNQAYEEVAANHEARLEQLENAYQQKYKELKDSSNKSIFRSIFEPFESQW